MGYFYQGRIILESLSVKQVLPAHLPGMAGWLQRWCPTVVFDGGGRCPHLRRFTLLAYAKWRLYLHQWIHDDWSLDLHDHSRRMISIGLMGSYTEQLLNGMRVTWKAPWIRCFPATHIHRVRLNTPAVWTLILAWPPSHNSAFYVQGQRVEVKKYMMTHAKQQPQC